MAHGKDAVKALKLKLDKERDGAVLIKVRRARASARGTAIDDAFMPICRRCLRWRW